MGNKLKFVMVTFFISAGFFASAALVSYQSDKNHSELNSQYETITEEGHIV